MFLYLPSFIILIGEGFVRLFNWPNNEKYFDEFKEKVKMLYIDSGCDISHIEVKENILLSESESFVDDDNSLHDYIGHGTQVISAITGKYHINGLYRNVEIVIYKITDRNGESKFEWLYNALCKAIKMDYKIINISYSGYTDNKYIISRFKKLIDEATQKNIHIFCSANNFEPGIGFCIPYDFNGVYKVGSINIENKISHFNSTTNPEYFAPGGDDFFDSENPQSFILLANSTLSNFNIGSEFGIDKRYTLNFGNSIACSYVACSIGLIVSRRKNRFKKDTSKKNIDCLFSAYKHKNLNTIKVTKEILKNEYI